MLRRLSLSEKLKDGKLVIDLFLCSYPILFNFKKVSGCRMYVNEFPEVDEVVMVQVLVFLSIKGGGLSYVRTTLL